MSNTRASTILVAWELGAGLGHVLPLLPLVQRFRAAGHRVFLALRDLSRAQPIFGDLGVSLLPAPFKIGRSNNFVAMPRTFAHVLANCGFGSDGELAGLAGAWRQLYEFVRPDLILFDHSPSALLAARAVSARRATLGVSFVCPPGDGPFPDLRRWRSDRPPALDRDEQFVLSNANRVLAAWGLSPLERLGQLYRDVDECFLTSFRELDAYPRRPAARYWGTWSTPGGATPVWPPGQGKRVFAYLKPFPALPHLLQLLNQRRVPTLVYIDRLDPQLQQKYQSATLRFVPRPLNLEVVGRHGDLAVLNAGHGATSTLLRAGCPILQIPLYLEQRLTAMAVMRMQAGHMASPRNADQIGAKLTDMLDSDKYALGASRFANRYCDYDPQLQVARVADRVNDLLADAGQDNLVRSSPAQLGEIDGGAETSVPERACPAAGVGAGDRPSVRIVVGTGSGQCGTKTLARLLNRQASTAVMHERAPLLPWDVSQAPHDMRSRFDALVALYPQVAQVGDIASYYLPYVDEIVAAFPQSKVVCLQRERERTVNSFLQLFDQTRPGRRVNHWCADRTGLARDPWDACFPKYATADLRTALDRYWDDYYRRANDLARKYPANFRIFSVPLTFSDPARRAELLDWLGILQN